jgi:hypothetical protein
MATLTPRLHHRTLHPAARLSLAVVIGVASAWPLWWLGHQPTHATVDFDQLWIAGRALLDGHDPYAVVGPGRTYAGLYWPWPLAYPLTAVLLVLPLAALPFVLARAVFAAIGMTVLAWALLRDGWWRLPILLSFPALYAARQAQWSPFFTAALLVPGFAAVAAAKPNLGLALVAAARSPRAARTALVTAIVAGLVLGVVSLIVQPDWPQAWIAALRMSPRFVSPILRPGGVLVLLALLRWRRPEARLLVVLACLPQTGHWYDALPLFLVPQTALETWSLVLLSHIGGRIWLSLPNTGTPATDLKMVGTFLVLSAYLPGVLMVLRRPNEGELPAWLERVAPRFPAFLRGSRPGHDLA